MNLLQANKQAGYLDEDRPQCGNCQGHEESRKCAVHSIPVAKRGWCPHWQPQPGWQRCHWTVWAKMREPADALAEAQEELAALRLQNHALRAKAMDFRFEQGLCEALNSGDGSYQP